MARPVKKDHEKRSTQLPPVRVTTSELAYVQRQADLAGMSVTDYLRTLALTEEVKPRKTKLEASLLVELNRIGVNLNQIARSAHIGRTEQAIMTYAIDHLVALMKRIDEGL